MWLKAQGVVNFSLNIAESFPLTKNIFKTITENQLLISLIKLLCNLIIFHYRMRSPKI